MRWSRHLEDLYDTCHTPLYSDHSGSKAAAAGDFIDCDLGTNPLGAPLRVSDVLHAMSVAEVARYPTAHCRCLAGWLIDYWGIRGVDPESIVFGSGCIDVLHSLLRIMPPKATLLGPSPQFPNFPVVATLSGLVYRPLLLRPPEYRIDPAALLEAITPDVDIVYLDRPHNPTGQVVPLDAVDCLARACEEADSLLLVDEAYGEFMDPADSALGLDHPNLVVTRSFSKGFGLAGARIGYAVIRNPRLATVYARLHPPFEVSGPNIQLAHVALEDGEFLGASRRYVRRNRPLMDAALERSGLQLAATDPCSPIVMVRSEQHDVVERLASAGIRATPGSGFLGLDDHAARVRLPSPAELPEMVRRLDRLAPRGAAPAPRLRSVDGGELRCFVQCVHGGCEWVDDQRHREPKLSVCAISQE